MVLGGGDPRRGGIGRRRRSPASRLDSLARAVEEDAVEKRAASTGARVAGIASVRDGSGGGGKSC